MNQIKFWWEQDKWDHILYITDLYNGIEIKQHSCIMSWTAIPECNLCAESMKQSIWVEFCFLHGNQKQELYYSNVVKHSIDQDRSLKLCSIKGTFSDWSTASFPILQKKSWDFCSIRSLRAIIVWKQFVVDSHLSKVIVESYNFLI